MIDEPERKRWLRWSRCKRENGIRMDVKETGYEPLI
jgi:hypothetical protein